MRPTSAQTPTEAMGITIKPRLPDFEFTDDFPSAMFPQSRPYNAMFNMATIMFSAAEAVFIRSAKQMLPMIKDPVFRDEARRYIQQEAYHSVVHGRLNRLLERRGYPVEPFQRFVADIMQLVEDCAGQSMVHAMSAAGEQAIGETGTIALNDESPIRHAIPEAQELFMWHFYEEVEHATAFFDAFHQAYGDTWRTYVERLVSLPYFATSIALMSGAGFFVFMEGEEADGGKRLRNWLALFESMLGAKGAIGGSTHVLVASLRKGFHPWKMHPDAAELLERRKDLVREEWVRMGRRGDDIVDRDEQREAAGSHE